MWYEQNKQYDFKKPEFSNKTGAFTQLIWYDTKSVGFGLAFNQRNKRLIGVANYDPPGNVATKFSDNVLALSTV